MKIKWFMTLLVLSGLTISYAESKDNSEVIVIEKNPTRLKESKVFVESGSDTIHGEPEGSIKPAYRTWEQACQTWKGELQRLNGKNLLFASCGSPEKSVETIQSEKWYTYRSKGIYKIRVADR